MGIFYFFCILAQTLGFGTDEAGVMAFANSSSPLGDLSGLVHLTDDVSEAVALLTGA